MKNKDKKVFSGSIAENTISENKEENTIEDTRVALKELLDFDWSEEFAEGFDEPIYMLSLENEVEYFYSINRKTFLPVKNNVEVFPLNTPDINNRLLENYYVINNEIFDIDPKKIVCVGWN